MGEIFNSNKLNIGYYWDCIEDFKNSIITIHQDLIIKLMNTELKEIIKSSEIKQKLPELNSEDEEIYLNYVILYISYSVLHNPLKSRNIHPKERGVLPDLYDLRLLEYLIIKYLIDKKGFKIENDFLERG